MGALEPVVFPGAPKSFQKRKVDLSPLELEPNELFERGHLERFHQVINRHHDRAALLT